MSGAQDDWRRLDPFGYLEDVYLDSEDAWDVLAEVLRAAGVCGLDSEFYGLDVRKESCVGRARVHVWSAAIRTSKRTPLGFSAAVGWVLPVAALLHPSIKAVLEDQTIRKCVHNQPVDDHAFHNHGVKLAGCVNTLGLARWKWPWLVSAGGFGLKNLMAVKLRREPIAEFKDVVNDVRQISVSKQKKVTRGACSCGEEGCRKRKTEICNCTDKFGNKTALLKIAGGLCPICNGGDYVHHVKIKTTTVEEVVSEKDEKFQHPLESIVVGHKRWDLLIRYAAEDAVAALEVEELAMKERIPAPWPYGDASAGPGEAPTRPDFNQAVEDCVVLMEREGFPIDVAYSAQMVELATSDEDRELTWLHKWFVVNGTEIYGPHRREEVDDIWSSPKQLGELFASLDFLASPIWKRGKVKPGDTKLDGTALRWIGKNYKPASQMIGHLLQLKKVRSSKKYMVKLSNSGGWVNVICGAAGDADDRNGAVTGRLGIKGTLEAQQLPTKEDVDIYQVRKAIVAVDMRTT